VDRDPRASVRGPTTGDYDPTATLDMDEAARDVEDAGRIVEMVTAHLGR
jgi:hypothetical protein